MNRIQSDEPDAMKQVESTVATLLGFAQKNPGMTRVLIGDALVNEDERLQARVNQRVTDAIAKYAKESVKFDKVTVPADERRQLTLLKNALVMVTPAGRPSRPKARSFRHSGTASSHPSL